jgi:hypothetical protein
VATGSFVVSLVGAGSCSELSTNCTLVDFWAGVVSAVVLSSIVVFSLAILSVVFGVCVFVVCAFVVWSVVGVSKSCIFIPGVLVVC